MSTRIRWILLLLCTTGVSGLSVFAASHEKKEPFDTKERIMFSDDFSSGKFKGMWQLAINERNNHTHPGLKTEGRLEICTAPGLPEGAKAFRAVVPRELGSFRSEIALPHEDGFQDRWYAARILVPDSWVFDTNGESDIVLQWHAVMGKERVDRDFPPLSIAIKNDTWLISRAFGDPADIRRDSKNLEGKVERGKWVSWVIHVKWTSEKDGRIEIWKDGKSVWEVDGPNTYAILARTPYFKTGIYHPDWKEKAREKFGNEALIIPSKTIFVTDIKVGNKHANYKEMRHSELP